MIKSTTLTLSSCVIILVCAGCTHKITYMTDPEPLHDSKEINNIFLHTAPLAGPYSDKRESSEYRQGHEDAWNDGVYGISLTTITEEIAKGSIHSKSSTPPKDRQPAYYQGWDDGKFALARRLNEVLQTDSPESQRKQLLEAKKLLQKNR